MKSLALVAALACVAGAPAALAQSTPPDYTPPPSTLAPAASASVPPMPTLDANQSAAVQRQLAPYRSQIDARIARGEITAEEGGRLLQWREWQIARQVARAAPPATAYDSAPPPGTTYDQAPPGATYDQAPPPSPTYDQAPPPVQPYYSQPYYVPYYRPYYAPYYGPAYYAPAPYYWGPRICAGGWGHHFGGRVCL